MSATDPGFDPYAVLGVPTDADDATIKRAYRKKARELHPDVAPGKEAQFGQASHAFDILSDPDRRAEYDTRARAPRATPRASTSGFGWDTMFTTPTRPTAPPQAPTPTPGSDIAASAHLTFTESVTGGTVSVLASATRACPSCPPAGLRVCADCSGTGTRVDPGTVSLTPCTSCRGTGRVRTASCARCADTGTISEDKAVTVRLPAGIRDGQVVRARGKGTPGTLGAPDGDALITCHIQAHPIFSRTGTADLTLAVPVTAEELITGADIDVPTLGGDPVRVRVASGTQPGATLRVRGRGAPSRTGPGDLLVTLELVLPGELTEEQRQLHARLAALGGARSNRDHLLATARTP